MATLSIVEHFDVLKQIGPGGLSRSVSNPVYALALEDTEEAFDNGVVVTIAGGLSEFLCLRRFSVMQARSAL